MSSTICDEHGGRTGCGRRGFLAGGAAAAVVAALGQQRALAQADSASFGYVDVHHHFMTDRFVEEGREAFMAEVRGMEVQARLLGWRVADSLAAMDKAGVATAMLSLNNPGVWHGDVKKARALCRDSNEYGARVMHDHPGRFGHFASLPLPDVDGSLKEIAYAFDTLRADGFIVHSNDQDIWLGSPQYAPVYEELNRRNAVLFVHPITGNCCKGIPIVSPTVLLEYPFDTARAITNWIFSGSAERFPNIRLIFSHGGGATPMLIGRLESLTRVKPELLRYVPQGVQHELGKLFYDTAAIYNAPALSAVRSLAPRSQVLFGTDVPYGKLETNIDLLTKIVTDPGDLRAIGRDNALALLPRYA